MARCRDCYHYEPCMEFSKIINAARDVEKGCDHFKDRSRIIELPCKLGDPVFIIGGKYRHGRFEKWINPSKFRLSDLEKLGKNVFLTHKEAEEALAKMEE